MPGSAVTSKTKPIAFRLTHKEIAIVVQLADELGLSAYGLQQRLFRKGLEAELSKRKQALITPKVA